MNTRKQLTQAFYLLCLVGASHPAAADTADASANAAAVKKLLAQASYWHSKAHDDMAIDALQKVLAADDKNIDAMYLMALYQLQQGNVQQSEVWRKKNRRYFATGPAPERADQRQHSAQYPAG